MTALKCININEAVTLLTEHNALAVDIRDHASFNQNHIKNARHLNNENLNDFLAEINQQTPLLVYCYHGISSKPAAEFLLQQGYHRVYSLNNGFNQWCLEQPELCEK